MFGEHTPYFVMAFEIAYLGFMISIGGHLAWLLAHCICETPKEEGEFGKLLENASQYNKMTTEMFKMIALSHQVVAWDLGSGIVFLQRVLSKMI